MLVLHPLVKGFTLNWCFVGLSRDITEEFGHILVDTVGFPDFPADFEVREKCRIVKREKVVALDVSIREAVIRVVDPQSSLFLDLGGIILGN